ncbi:unnamed protein product [Plutella xylostella]|uniref:(diamondback moth) hypothetical protein n=1 Tax=Plutella xylostella TaxID=51655 RepID=A0A8S4FM94_PLUXY|nr:unnamed protein product [Plutella xylostella]
MELTKETLSFLFLYKKLWSQHGDDAAWNGAAWNGVDETAPPARPWGNKRHQHIKKSTGSASPLYKCWLRNEDVISVSKHLKSAPGRAEHIEADGAAAPNAERGPSAQVDATSHRQMKINLLS